MIENIKKIIWREDPYLPLQEFTLNTITYGTASDPFLAMRCIKQLAKEEHNTFQLGSVVLANDMYVDDLLTGADSKQRAEQIRDEVIEIANKGGFTFRKWCSNDNSLVECLQGNSDDILCLDNSSVQKTLDIYWKPSSDEITYSIRVSRTTNSVTKRIILSKIAQLFDPLGLLGPVITTAKLIMMQLWKLKSDWDESVPINLYNTWTTYESKLHVLANFRIPRCIISEQSVNIQLHGFCDASQDAYGACIYIRSSQPDGVSHSALLCSVMSVSTSA